MIFGDLETESGPVDRNMCSLEDSVDSIGTVGTVGIVLPVGPKIRREQMTSR